MKLLASIFFLLASAGVALSQGTSSEVEIVTTYSENGNYYLRSKPFDNQFPTMRGTTSVYRTGNATPLYVIERGFDSVSESSNNLFLSNDGEVIFYVLSWGANETQDGLKSISIYRTGKLIKSLTEAEITQCDYDKERCDLQYSNYDEVVDRVKSNWGTNKYKKVFKPDVTESERFLSDFALFSDGEIVYLTDSKKQTHKFDLQQGTQIGSESFEHLFANIKNKGRSNRTEISRYSAPLLSDFPKLADGGDTYHNLGALLGMKPASTSGNADDAFKLYSFKLNSNIARDGSLEIESIEFWGGKLPEQQITEFFKSHRFDSSAVPAVFEKWNLGDDYFHFRKADDQVARLEKQQEIVEQREAYQKRLVAETLKGVYIPRDLEECFLELEKLLKEIDKQEIQALSKREEMIRYHMGMGMWLRNNWGLWGGSRLSKYFNDHGVTHPDDMSHVILVHYFDWRHGKKTTWKEWERKTHRR